MKNDLALPMGVREGCSMEIISEQGLEEEAFSGERKEDPENRGILQRGNSMYSFIYQILKSCFVLDTVRTQR